MICDIWVRQRAYEYGKRYDVATVPCVKHAQYRVWHSDQTWFACREHLSRLIDERIAAASDSAVVVQRW